MKFEELFAKEFIDINLSNEAKNHLYYLIKSSGNDGPENPMDLINLLKKSIERYTSEELLSIDSLIKVLNLPTKFPKGIYIIGDPCYVIIDDWDKEYSKEYDLQNDKSEEYFSFESHTANGDGWYEDNEGTCISVEGGQIGIFSESVLGKLDYDSHPYSDYFYQVEIPFDFVPREEGGIFYFGNIEIDTNEYDDEDEDHDGEDDKDLD
jgi:hypothetical protein